MCFIYIEKKGNMYVVGLSWGCFDRYIMCKRRESDLGGCKRCLFIFFWYFGKIFLFWCGCM